MEGECNECGAWSELLSYSASYGWLCAMCYADLDDDDVDEWDSDEEFIDAVRVRIRMADWDY